MTTKAVERTNERAAAVALPADAKPTSVLVRLALRFGVDQSKMMDCLKATAFKGGATNEQIMALCIVADQYGLNPWTKEIYAFPDKNNGIVPVVGVDGWARIINQHPEFDGMEFEQDAESCTCSIFRKDRGKPTTVTEWLDECKRATGPWGSHPKRMLRHKAMVQCARIAFGYAGIKDEDEAERILSAQSEGVTVSPAPYAMPAKRLPPPPEPPAAPVEDEIPMDPPAPALAGVALLEAVGEASKPMPKGKWQRCCHAAGIVPADWEQASDEALTKLLAVINAGEIE